nr:hypothetical protein [Prolixibacteraceae bacterium]
MKYKKCKLILVETGERAMPDQLSLNNTSNKLFMMDKRTYNAWQKPGLENFGEHLRGQYLYIISLDPDEKIEENDWCYVTESHKDLLKGDILNYNGECSINPDKIKKIIASSDELDSEIIHEKYPNGVNIGIRSCVVLPQPSPEYIQQFITEYNEGNVQDIKVEYEEGEDYLAGNCNGNEIWSAYPDKLKLTNGYITIKEIETNYSFYTDLNMSFKAGANDFI